MILFLDDSAYISLILTLNKNTYIADLQVPLSYGSQFLFALDTEPGAGS